MPYIPVTLEISSAGSNGSSAQPVASPGLVSIDLMQIATAADMVFQATGSRTLRMGAGQLSLASPAQIGRVISGVTITADIVQQNQKVFDQLGVWCRANGVQLVVEIQADNPPAQDWTYQWLSPAVEAMLPIAAVENDNEVEIGTSQTAFAQRAIYMSQIISQVAACYPTVRIGQWVGGSPLAAQQWWHAYNAAAESTGLPPISYIVADASMNTPWLTTPAVWQAWFMQLSQLVQGDALQLKALLDGVQTAGSGIQWTAQVEQKAAMLARIPNISLSTLILESWVTGWPASTIAINSPTTLGNAAVEVAALFPLYHGNQITAQSPVTLFAPSQLVAPVGTPAPLPALSLTWADADVAAGARVTVVITDQTGTLTASNVGAATVSGAGSAVLILNGTAVDLAAELATVTVTEAVAGPDTIDVEVFGASGRCDDRQIQVLATCPQPKGSAAIMNFIPTALQQPWTAATATMSNSGIVQTLVMAWNLADHDQVGTALPTRMATIHEPLAGNVRMVNGVPEASLANPPSGSAASLPIGLSSYNPAAFNRSSQLFAVEVTQSTLIFDISGRLQSLTDILAPSTPTALIVGSKLENYFALGGRQTTQYNTGSNPDWQPCWNTQFASVTTTYCSSGQMIEQDWQGGATKPWLSLTNVFSPYTGALWEQFETAPPPAGSTTSVTGVKYITIFNSGDNPDWDYTDWNDAPQVTVTWQDYYAKAVDTTPPSNETTDLPCDLSVSGLTLPLTSLISGENYAASFVVSDSGLRGAVPTIQFYLGKTPVFDATTVGTFPIGSAINTTSAIPAGSSLKETASFSIPSTVSPGNYYIYAYIDPARSVGDTDYSNNVVGMPITLVPWTEFDSGASINTVVIGLARLQATIAMSNTNGTVLGPGLAHRFTSNERISFIDGTMAYSADTTEAQVVRMYQAALGRAPDPIGLAKWVAVLKDAVLKDGGSPSQVTASLGSLNQVAVSFIGSNEFQTRFPGASQTATAFVTQLYANALHRAPDSPGLAYWVEMLQSGARTQSQVLTAFSESLESRGNTAGILTNGIWVADEHAASVARLYYSALGRAPEAGGLIAWTTLFKSGGQTLQQEAAAFMSSPEGKGKYYSLTNADFVNLLYHNVLGRQADSAGIAAWNDTLNTGSMSRASVLVGFSESLEHQILLAPKIEASGVVLA